MKIYNYNEMTDSVMFYRRNPPSFNFWIIIVFIALLAAATTWAGLSQKDSVVKANFVVSTNDKSMIMVPTVGGQITEFNIYEGAQVSQGDVLIEFDDTSVVIQMIALESSIEYLKNYVSYYETLINSIKNITYDNYEQAVNPFKEDTDISYEFKLNYDSVIEQAISSIEYIDVDESEETYEEEKEDAFNDSIIQYVSSYLGEKAQYEYEMVSNEGQYEAYKESLDTYSVIAQVDGIIHLNNNLNVGNVLTGGSLIGYIVQDITKENVIIEAYVPISQVVLINVNDSTELAFSGILQSDYGTIIGEVISIAVDTTTDDTGENTYYKVLIKPEEIELKNKKDEIVELSTGLAGEARIEYCNMSWLTWVGTQIGIVK
jgi:multidrug resistance efflux pump